MPPHHRPMTDSPLRRELGRLLRQQREAAGLTAAELASRAGTTPSNVSRVERATLAASLDTVERLFAALGLQLRLETEPMLDLDSQLDRLAWLPLPERLARSGVCDLLESVSGFAYVIDGALAATLHGVPLPIDALDIAVAWSDADAFTRWLLKRFAYRWHERSEEFRMLDLDPRAPGPHYWQTTFGQVRARMCDELPDSEPVTVDERTYQVRPLDEVTPTDPEAVRLLRRFRERMLQPGRSTLTPV